MAKRVGPRIVPWSTPDSAGHLDEETQFRKTHCIRQFKKEEIQIFGFPLMPNCHSDLYSRLWCGTVSNVLAKSVKMMSSIIAIG